jgi:ubiquinone/menaquinone biosynthesis C-methylase UbiE
MGKEIVSVNYDRISEIYDTSRAAHPETVEKLGRLLSISGNSKILDMGCGTGNYIYALRKMTDKIIGLDMSAGMLAQAKTKYPKISFVQADVTNLPFKSETFDGTFAVQVLHHIKEKERFLREAHRNPAKTGAYRFARLLP